MEVKTENVFLVQGRDENANLKPFVIISNTPINAKLKFDTSLPTFNFVGITTFVEYINVHKNILASLNGDQNAWPLIVDQANINKDGI